MSSLAKNRPLGVSSKDSKTYPTDDDHSDTDSSDQSNSDLNEEESDSDNSSNESSNASTDSESSESSDSDSSTSSEDESQSRRLLVVSKSVVLQGIEQSWLKLLDTKLLDEALKNINKLKMKTNQCTPSPDKWFQFARITPFDKICCVIIGQDPYFEPSVATGLSFDCKTKVPKSAVNIFKCLVKQGFISKPPETADLSTWALQGVVLMNMAFSTLVGKAKAHTKIWQEYTESLVESLSKLPQRPVFILWGNDAKAVDIMIDVGCKSVSWGHPSPLNTRGQFEDCTNFTDVNKLLVKKGKPPVNWGSIEKDNKRPTEVKQETKQETKQQDKNEKKSSKSSNDIKDIGDVKEVSEIDSNDKVSDMLNRSTILDIIESMPDRDSTNIIDTILFEKPTINILTKDEAASRKISYKVVEQLQLTSRDVIVFTDGSCYPNNKSSKARAGYSVYMPYSPFNITYIYGSLDVSQHYASNIRGEGYAILSALNFLQKSDNIDNWHTCNIITDCMLWIEMIQVYMPKWHITNSFEDHENSDITTRLYKLVIDLRKNKKIIKLFHIQSHNKSGWNNKPSNSYEKFCYTGNTIADEYANKGRKELQPKQERII